MRRGLITAGLVLGAVRCAPEYSFDDDDGAAGAGGSADHCHNDRQDRDLGETRVDCGGECPPCPLVCPAGTDECDGNSTQQCETNLLTSVDHCGKCGTHCELAAAEARCSGGACMVASCLEPFDNCNSRSDDGCEVNLTTNAAHCGRCGESCSKINGTPFCDGGACLIDCKAGWDDCNDDRADGCERPTTSDTLNCGECGNVCEPAPGETPFCADGTCGSTLCEDELGDCDGDGKCEDDLDSDPMNCGRCGNPCLVSNGVGSCEEGVCVVDSCDTGYENCDTDREDGGFVTGCEVNILDSVDNCGDCGKACSIPNATADCSNGQCRVSACTAPFGDCNQDGVSCETDTSEDTTNCGGCADAGGLNCATEFGAVNATGVCSDGKCTFDGCQTSFLDCDEDGFSCEVDRRVEREHCGACDVMCETPTGTTDNVCLNAACKPECADGYENCDRDGANGCEDIRSSTQHCGACNSPCSTAGTSGNRCLAGACDPSCLRDRGDCNRDGHDGCETSLTANAAHCGACDRQCETPTGTRSNPCVSSNCAPSCGNLYGNCDKMGENGCETFLGGNDPHCGACDRECRKGGNTHATSNTCNAQGQCEPDCAEGYAACESPELGCTASLDSPEHCGSCTKRCGGATPNCVDRICQSKIAILDEKDGGIYDGRTLTINANLVSGDNRLLLVVVTGRIPSNGSASHARPDSVVYGGITMRPSGEFDAGLVPVNSDGQNHFFAYTLNESDFAGVQPGSKQLVIRGDVSPPSPTFMAANAILFSGVRQTDSISSAVGRAISATCQTTQPSATITVATRGSVVYSMVAAQYPGVGTAMSPLTRVMEFEYKPYAGQSLTFVQGGHIGIATELPAGNVTTAWNFSYCGISTVYDVAIRPVQAP